MVDRRVLIWLAALPPMFRSSQSASWLDDGPLPPLRGVEDFLLSLRLVRCNCRRLLKKFDYILDTHVPTGGTAPPMQRYVHRSGETLITVADPTAFEWFHNVGYEPSRRSTIVQTAETDHADSGLLKQMREFCASPEELFGLFSGRWLATGDEVLTRSGMVTVPTADTAAADAPATAKTAARPRRRHRRNLSSGNLLQNPAFTFDPRSEGATAKESLLGSSNAQSTPDPGRTRSDPRTPGTRTPDPDRTRWDPHTPVGKVAPGRPRRADSPPEALAAAGETTERSTRRPGSRHKRAASDYGALLSLSSLVQSAPKPGETASSAAEKRSAPVAIDPTKRWRENQPDAIQDSPSPNCNTMDDMGAWAALLQPSSKDNSDSQAAADSQEPSQHGRRDEGLSPSKRKPSWVGKAFLASADSGAGVLGM